MRRVTKFLLAALAACVLGNVAEAQFPGPPNPFGPPVTQRPGFYFPQGNGTGFNPTTGSTYIPGVAAVKPSGVYNAVGGGYYQNPFTGNVYNPRSGSYVQGNQGGVEFRPGGYFSQGNGTGYNPFTGSTHIPGVAVVKPTGVYNAVGGGYYQNPVTGNVYNPTTRAYIR